MDRDKLDLAEQQVRFVMAARDVLNMVRSRLFIEFRFLSAAIGRLEIENDDLIKTTAVDGNVLYYNARHIVKTYNEEPNAVNRMYMHTVLHCVFRHMFVSPKIDKKKWDTACNIAVENILTEMDSELLKCRGEQFQEETVQKLKSEIKSLTAERIYKYFNDNNFDDEKIEKISEFFDRDNHETWYPDRERENNNSDTNSGEGSDDLLEKYKNLEKEWEDISSRIDVDLETLSRENGGTKALLQQLQEVNRDKYDYREFLKKFAVRGEDITVNDEEFDYIYYTYGLQKYGNMPLVEPLEYKEINKINDFVIAIDTSGSCQGEVVQKFLEKTYSILMQEESFFKKINVRIIQCDDKIEEEVLIKSKDDFDTYMKFMTIKGFGGTDFRPVFERVDELINKKQFKKLKGVIYFTDGYGHYPERKPMYEAAFIFLGYDKERPQPPAWAIKLVLDEQQLEE